MQHPGSDRQTSHRKNDPTLVRSRQIESERVISLAPTSPHDRPPTQTAPTGPLLASRPNAASAWRRLIGSPGLAALEFRPHPLRPTGVIAFRRTKAAD